MTVVEDTNLEDLAELVGIDNYTSNYLNVSQYDDDYWESLVSLKVALVSIKSVPMRTYVCTRTVLRLRGCDTASELARWEQ